jgi:MFS family permease
MNAIFRLVQKPMAPRRPFRRDALPGKREGAIVCFMTIAQHHATGADSARSWARLGVAVLAASIACFGTWATVLVLPSIQAEFGGARGDAALAYSCVMAGFAVGNMWLGKLVDRHGMAKVMFGAALALAASFGAGAASPNLIIFSLLQFPVGVASAAGFGPLIADTSHWFLRQRGIAVAITASGNYLSGSIGPQLLSGIVEKEGWREAYLVTAAATLILLAPVSLLLRSRPPEAAVAAAGAQAAVNRQTAGISPATLQWMLAFAGVACCVAMSMPQVHIVAYCSDLGYGITAGAQMLSIMLAAGIISRLIGGMIADRIGGVRTLILSSSLQCLALIAYLPFDSLGSLFLVSMFFGLAQGGIVPSYAIIVREYLPPAEAGRRVGIVISGTTIGMALGGWMSGAIYDHTGSYEAAFANGIAWNIANLAIMFALLMRSRPRAAVKAA